MKSQISDNFPSCAAKCGIFPEKRNNTQLSAEHTKTPKEAAHHAWGLARKIVLLGKTTHTLKPKLLQLCIRTLCAPNAPRWTSLGKGDSVLQGQSEETLFNLSASGCRIYIILASLNSRNIIKFSSTSVKWIVWFQTCAHMGEVI